MRSDIKQLTHIIASPTAVQLRERLVATLAAADALAAHAVLLEPPAAGAKPPTAAARRTSESRAAKAWNRLCRLATRAAVEETYRCGVWGAGSKVCACGGSVAVGVVHARPRLGCRCVAPRGLAARRQSILVRRCCTTQHAQLLTCA